VTATAGMTAMPTEAAAGCCGHCGRDKDDSSVTLDVCADAYRHCDC